MALSFKFYRITYSPSPPLGALSYSDADWAGCKINRKSTSGTCQFLGRSLVSWASKKQNSVALSTAEAEYIATGHCCAQLLWMRQTLRDYGYKLTKVPLLCDNESAICRCFGSDRTPGVAPQGVFRSRTVSTTVAKWFVPIARGTMDKIYRFGPLRSA